MSKTAVITGAGSGVGRATAHLLSDKGWSLVLVGRTLHTLQETQKLLGTKNKVLIHSCDISQPEAVEQLAAAVAREFDRVDVLVNGAGTNTPKRSLKELSFEKYREIIETNLTGAYLCTQAFLKGMRAVGQGTIINIVSDAAKQASPKAGPAYAASKFGMLGLTQAINAEERPNGIRACAILPGDINTPLLDKRPLVPDAEARVKMLQPEDVARCVWLALDLPPRAVIEEILIRPA